MKKKVAVGVASLCLAGGLATTPAMAAEATVNQGGVSASDEVASPVDDGYSLEGSCGASAADSVTWKLTQNNDDTANPTYTLTFSGKGATADYNGGLSKGDQPWRKENSGVDPTAITKVIVEEGVTRLGQQATDGAGVVEYSFPPSLTELGVWALSAEKATTFNLNGNKHFVVSDGVLYSADMTTMILYPGGAEARDEFTVPSSVNTIAGGAFVGCDARKVTIPSAVTSMDGWSFNSSTVAELDIDAEMVLPQALIPYSETLEKVTVGPHVKGLGQNAFAYCNKLTTVSLPDGLEEIAWGGFCRVHKPGGH